MKQACLNSTPKKMTKSEHHVSPIQLKIRHMKQACLNFTPKKMTKSEHHVSPIQLEIRHMKYVIISFVFLFFQISFSQDVYIGAKAGVNLSSFIGVNTSHFSQRTSFHAGFSTEFSFSELFSLQVEALYSEKGAVSNTTVYPVNYISIPFLVRVYPNELISLDAGVQYAYLLNDNYLETEKHSLGIDQSDFSIIGGLTLKTRNDFYFQVRYIMGVVEIDKSDNWRSKVFQFSVGYNFM